MNKIKKFAVYLIASACMALPAAAQDVISSLIAGPNGIPAVNANLNQPAETAVDAAGNVYVASTSQNRIFRFAPGGAITVVAGNGDNNYSGDGGKATLAGLNGPFGVAVDNVTPLPNVYIGDSNNCLIRKVNQNTGIITTIAGNVTYPATGVPYSNCGYSGNGGSAVGALLDRPFGVAWDPTNGDIYFAEYGNGVVRAISTSGTLYLIAGSGGSTGGANCGGGAPYGDGTAATAAYLCYPQAVELDTSGSKANLLISEGGRCAIRDVVGATGEIYLVAGDYSLGCGYSGDGGPATSAQLYDPWQMHLSVSGASTAVQFADYNNARIRQFHIAYTDSKPSSGTITTIAGDGQGGFCNDGGSALQACMNPVGLAYDSKGNFYIGDYGSDRVRKVTASTGDIATVAGWGFNGGTNQYYSNPVGIENTPGTPSLYYPLDVYADPYTPNIYVGGYQGQAIYKYNTATKETSDFAGDGNAGFDGDGGAADNAATQLNYPIGVSRDSAGNIYIADNNNCAIREVLASNGNIITVVGGSSGHLNGCGFSGDGGTAVNAQLYSPNSVVVDGLGDLYIADYNNCAVRKVAHGSTIISTVVGGPTLGCGFSGDGGLAVKAQIRNPNGIALDGAGNIYIGDTSNNRIREIIVATGVIQTVAGNPIAGYSGDGPALGNSLNQPGWPSADANGNFFFSDVNNQIVRWVTTDGTMITVAGTPDVAGFFGDGGKATSAEFYYPEGISRDSAGNIYVADYYNWRIRQITPFAGFGFSTKSLSFETQGLGYTSSPLSVKVNIVGPTIFTAITPSSSAFTEIDNCVGATLVAGNTCTVDVYFKPTAAGSFAGNLIFSSNAQFTLNPNKVAISGTGAGLSLTPVSYVFPVELINSKSTQTTTLKNNGTTAVKISSIALETTTYKVTGGSCPTAGGTLAGGASCTITITFDPTATGYHRDTLTITSNDPSSPLLSKVTGRGTVVTLSPTSLAYGNVTEDGTVTKDVTVTNTGKTSLTVSAAIVGPNASQFAILTSGSNTCTSAVAAGKSCTLPVIFNPTSVGSFTATVDLTTSDGGDPTIALSGTGVAK